MSILRSFVLRMITERLFCVKDLNDGRIWCLHPGAAAHPEEHKDRGKQHQAQGHVKDCGLVQLSRGGLAAKKFIPKKPVTKVRGMKRVVMMVRVFMTSFMRLLMTEDRYPVRRRRDRADFRSHHAGVQDDRKYRG